MLGGLLPWLSSHLLRQQHIGSFDHQDTVLPFFELVWGSGACCQYVSGQARQATTVDLPQMGHLSFSLHRP